MTRRKQIESIAAIVLLFLLIARWQHKWLYVYIAAGLVLLSSCIPAVARWLSVGWMKIGKAIGAVMGRVLLAVVFIVIVIPVSIIARWNKKLHIQIKLKPGKQTNFEQRDHLYSEADFKDPW